MGNVKNISASVGERLKNIAKQSGKTFDLILLLYFQERLLYRLSISNYRDKFILKGGLVLFSLTQFKSRPTKDIDFLARQISNDIQYIKAAFESICTLTAEEDGVEFDVKGITAERIKEGADYEGIRIKIPAALGKIKKQLQLDIGFGDVVIPKPQEMQYPTLLNMKPPEIRVYSTYSVIAEKFEAMISLSVVNSRMKDFYDIFTLLSTENFDGRVLWEAIFETFQRRGTHLEKGHPVFSPSFAEDESRNKQWKAFLQRTGIKEDLQFPFVMEKIRDFLFPVYDSILNEDEFFEMWNCQILKWE
ncbi:nucleotidyl transferase AbiEii/AbiGii toxin family protein [Ureibacillus thermosphaericus]|uniref:Putative nucleotidyltransferase component of viral defense system n=1 Tax=Ureibacillus thermosphaericus TaxID=51173 RepID=A0A840Q1K3_URETH|nr:nucleotidyl transferase AbiEii/AbiGii toxin family protein [Ureibacillus thermosphaericus]MBB5150348.1 putative nucleotidyltransferase component of viral defense system [Ureibacillus thermosphaericus]NKZ32960.1 nucleotidyl transferase AbiEii/AbiGii toxin family protein [Ureibacillus thermosphaericus]